MLGNNTNNQEEVLVVGAGESFITPMEISFMSTLAG